MMKIRTGIIPVAAILALICLGPALAGRGVLDPAPEGAIRALEIELNIRIDPEKTLWYRIHVVEDSVPHHTSPARSLEIDEHHGSGNERADTSPTGQIKDGITVVRALLSAVVTLFKHWFAAAHPTSGTH